MISHPERQQYVQWIYEAVAAGATKQSACELACISIRTLQRWCTEPNEVANDKRSNATRPIPANKLTEVERQAIIDICNKKEFAQASPAQIVPRLADRGVFIASEATFYRVLKQAGMLHHRGRAKPKGSVKKPTSHIASGPNQVWSWDISYLASTVIGQFFYLYMIVDIYSRKIVGWEVHDSENGELGAKLVERAVWSEQCVHSDVVLHSDNGSPMKSMTMQAKLYELGLIPSRSRPGVSNDNPFSESLFRTLKYCPRWPSEGFKTIAEAREWVCWFVHWYNTEHQHSRIKFVTPEQKHNGMDAQILNDRHALYQEKKLENPARWSCNTRNWTPVESVKLNPEKSKVAA
jgi:transposase InsO family protein